MGIKYKIQEQEMKDRFVATQCLKKILYKGSNLQINPTQITDFVDLNCKVTNTYGKEIPFNVEIKERFKSEQNLLKYPNAELKVDKYNRMRFATPQGTKLFYMVLLNNEKCFLYDLDKLDWNKVQMKNWRIKKTQMNPNSEFITVPTFFIPYSEATCTIDCSEYFQQYQQQINNN